jgi:type I restriction enzyme S subunit
MNVTPFVYFYYLLLKNKQDEIYRLQRGAAQPHVYPKDLMELEMIDFPDEIISQFNVIIKPFFDLLSNLKNGKRNLIKARSSFLEI